MSYVPKHLRGFNCELPNSDAVRCCSGLKEMLQLLRDNGAKTIVYDDKYGVWRCTDPEWIAGREAYSEAKARECAIWGCE